MQQCLRFAPLATSNIHGNRVFCRIAVIGDSFGLNSTLKVENMANLSQLTSYKEFFISLCNDDLLNIMRALADPTRLRIVFLIRRLELSVGEVVQILGQSQPRVSRHIRILDEAGILERRKEGSWVFLRPGSVLNDGTPHILFGEADITQAKAFQRDLLGWTKFVTPEPRWRRNISRRMRANGICSVPCMWRKAKSKRRSARDADGAAGTCTGCRDRYRPDDRAFCAKMLDRFVALDNSTEMLRLARAKLAGLMIEVAGKVDIMLGDFNALPLPTKLLTRSFSIRCCIMRSIPKA